MTHRLIGLLSTLFLAACSGEPADVLDFRPDQQEQRRYQIMVETEVASVDARGERYAERIQQTELRSYRVTGSEPERAQIAVQPEYLHAQADSGYSFGSVIGTMNNQDRQLLSALSEGSTLEVDVNDGQATKPLSSRYQDGRRRLLGNLNQIQQVLTQPGLASGMQLQPGTTRRIEGNPEQGHPALTLRLREVNDETLLFSVTADSDLTQVYGRLLMDRESGWLIRAGIITKSEFTADDDAREVRTTMTIAPAEWPYGELLLQSSLTEIEMDFIELPENLDHLTTATEGQIFADSKGQVMVNGDRLELQYTHPLDEAEEVGHFRFTELQAFNEQGEALDLQFEAQRPFSYQGENQKIVTYANAFPLGWDGVEASLTQIHSIEVAVQWFPQALQLVPIDVPEQGASELNHGGARARLEATDNPREFDLYLFPTRHQLFGIQVYGAQTGVLDSIAIEDGADWLTDKERNQLNVIQYGEFPTHTRLTFDEQVPQQLRLVTYTVEQQPAAQRVLQFEVR